MSRFVIWASAFHENSCVVGGLSGAEDSWELKEGIPRAEGWPSGVSVRMLPGDPHATKLLDNVMNVERVIIISTRLKEFLAARQLHNAEFLPIDVIDLKERPIAGRFFLLHPIHPQPILDPEESGAVYSELDEERINEIERLVIDETKLDPEDLSLFRLQGYFKLVLIDRNIAEAIDAEGFAGVRWIDLANYPED